jgi:hypothetical protein
MYISASGVTLRLNLYRGRRCPQQQWRRNFDAPHLAMHCCLRCPFQGRTQLRHFFEQSQSHWSAVDSEGVYFYTRNHKHDSKLFITEREAHSATCDFKSALCGD